MEKSPHPDTIQRLFEIFNNLEDKLSSIKIIHENLFQLITLVSNTQENILQNLNYVKNLLNQYKINQSNEQKDSLTIVSTSSDESLSTNENIQTSDSLSRNIKSSKSVTFSLDQDHHQHQQRKRTIRTFQQFPKEKKTPFYPQVTTPINSALSSEFVQENRILVEPSIDILTNIRIDEIECENGDYLRLRNQSTSDDYDLTDHFIQQTIDSKLFCRFVFPFDTILRAGQTITIWCGSFKDIIPQPPHIFLWKEQRKWETKPQCFTILAKPTGETIASYRNTQHISTDQSSSDILHIHSARHSIPLDFSRISSRNSFNIKQNLFSSNDFYGNRKPPFAHSTTNPIHPDYNQTISQLSNYHRSFIHQQKLLNRPKSSPFANHINCKQDLNSIQRQKQRTTIFN